MARDEDFKSRRRREEKEEIQRETTPQPAGGGPAPSGQSDSERLDEMLKRAEPMVEQLSNLYNMYIAGVEKLPPIERRKQLDQLVQTIQGMSKPLAGQRFKWTTFQAHYLTNRDRWDKLMRDLEDGKIQRRK